MIKDSGLPPQPPPNMVSHTFAKLGHSTGSKADLNAWVASSLEENNVAITRGIANIYFMQANRYKDLRALINTHKEVVKEAKLYKTPAESVTEEMRAMARTHKKHVDEVASKINELEKKLKEAKEERNIDLDKHV